MKSLLQVSYHLGALVLETLDDKPHPDVARHVIGILRALKLPI